MGVRHRLIQLALGTLATSLACSACKRDERPKTEAKPPDHLAPSEVVESKERAFGLPLPRQSRVEARFAQSVHVVSSLTSDELASFVRARVTATPNAPVPAGGPATGPTVLERVVPREDSTKQISVEVRAIRTGDGMRSEMIVRDTTPPPADPSLSNEERWRRAGLKPDGTLLDPKKLE